MKWLRQARKVERISDGVSVEALRMTEARSNIHDWRARYIGTAEVLAWSTAAGVLWAARRPPRRRQRPSQSAEASSPAPRPFDWRQLVAAFNTALLVWETVSPHLVTRSAPDVDLNDQR